MADIKPDASGVYSKAKADSIFNSLNKVLANESNAAQITANLIDYCDNDSDVTAYTPPTGGGPYYGFERPCIYISELAYKITNGTCPGPPPGYTPISCVAHSYAIELFKPYTEDAEPDTSQKWQLKVDSIVVEGPIDWTKGSNRFHVVVLEDSNVPYISGSSLNNTNDVNGPSPPTHNTDVLPPDALVELQREVPSGSGNYITVDSTSFSLFSGFGPDGTTHNVEKNIAVDKCIRNLWDSSSGTTPTLGSMNAGKTDDHIYIQAHPANKGFTNVGEIGTIFRKSAYPVTHPPVANWIASADTEADVRVNLAGSHYQRIFDYLTVFDPTHDTINNDNDAWTNETEPNKTPEFKIPGRININTAPWYVIAQLPWMTNHLPTGKKCDLAKAIIAYRDKLDIPVNYSGSNGRYNALKNQNRLDPSIGSANIREDLGFESIGELNFVLGYDDAYRIDYYATASSAGDLAQYPDLTPGDNSADDFEERDVIFSRISNLITVRSDVFTAYILVRIGPDGPQKRVIAILDRSDIYSARDKVKIVALWPVPDSR
jgi:hypothetical protein